MLRYNHTQFYLLVCGRLEPFLDLVDCYVRCVCSSTRPNSKNIPNFCLFVFYLFNQLYVLNACSFFCFVVLCCIANYRPMVWLAKANT